jgi:hypothetical protein
MPLPLPPPDHPATEPSPSVLFATRSYCPALPRTPQARAAEGAQAGVLRDCVLLKPGSSTEDLYQVLKKPPYQLLEGEFVRAEARALDAAACQQAEREQQGELADGGRVGGVRWRVLKKEEQVGFGGCIVRIMTNRKVSWQHRTK